MRTIEFIKGYLVQDVPYLTTERLTEIVTNDADHSAVRQAALEEIKRRERVNTGDLVFEPNRYGGGR